MFKSNIFKVWIISLAMALISTLGLSGVGAAQAASSKKVPFSGCYVYGTLLAGKVQVVTSSFGSPTDQIPTYTVQVVSSFPDLKVKQVTSFPNKCGEWQMVKSFPKFKIRYVTSFPDFTIKMVTSFPGR